MSGRAASAELIEDRGEAAVSDQFFRSRPFLDAEGVTHTLRIVAPAGVELLAPLIVREIPDAAGARDAISPYGYPGLSRSGRSSSRYAVGTATSGDAVSVDPGGIDFAPTGLVSAFIRHTLAEPPPLAGSTERSVVLIADPELPAKHRPSDRNQINRNRRNGYRVRVVHGPATVAADRIAFLGAYEQTMRRASAADRYFFDIAYFDRILESELSWLALADSPAGDACAASIAVLSDGFLHYYLSGTADSALRDSPMKNIVAALVELSADRAAPLNLGGGIAPGDRLEEFKRGFANRELSWRVSELICDPERYEQLVPAGAADDFFPAYRAPSL